MNVKQIKWGLMSVSAAMALMLVVGCSSEPESPVATTIGPVMVEVDSSVFSRVGYDAVAQELLVEFAESGQTYLYSDVPAAVAEAFLAADSHGRYYHEEIRGQYESILR